MMSAQTPVTCRNKPLCLQKITLTTLIAGILVVSMLGVLGFCLGSISKIKFTSPESSSWIDDRNGEFIGEITRSKGGERGFWQIKELPDRVVQATIAIEDKRFFWHKGIDFIAIARAFWLNTRSGERISGASTLAMQVARLQDPGPRTIGKKISEMMTALGLIARYGHQDLLRQYLRIVPYGNQVHGIAHAARSYFDKPADDLSWAEIAFLTAIPQSPGKMNPYTPEGRRKAVERGKRILTALQQSALISTAEYDLAVSQITNVRIPVKPSRSRSSIHPLLRMEQIIDVSHSLPTYYYKAELDLELQEKLSLMMKTSIESWASRGAGNASAIVLDLTTNSVLAYVGSTDYDDKGRCGAINYALIPRSSGSTLKPFIFGFALDRGVITPATVLDDLYRGTSGITNADESYLGPLLPRQALANSRNVPAVNLLAKSGLDEVFQYFFSLGLHKNSKPARHYGLGLAIGGLPVTLEQLVTAYSALGRDGYLSALKWFSNQETSESRKVFSTESARQITLFLSDPAARIPSFARMSSTEFEYPVAIKTGTSSGHRDEWAIAYSTQYLAGVWVGHPGNSAMQAGTRFAADLVHRIMDELHQDQKGGLNDLGFPAPPGYQPVRICCLSGKCATVGCTQVIQEYFAPGQQPTQLCDVHLQIPVDIQTGERIYGPVDIQYARLKTVLNLPGKYASWAESKRFETVSNSNSLLDFSLKGFRSKEIKITIVYPEHGMHLIPDPEMPFTAMLPLKAIVDPPVESIIWLVDGMPFKSSKYPFEARWPIAPGEHVFQAVVPETRESSQPVSVSIDSNVIPEKSVYH